MRPYRDPYRVDPPPVVIDAPAARALRPVHVLLVACLLVIPAVLAVVLRTP